MYTHVFLFVNSCKEFYIRNLTVFPLFKSFSALDNPSNLYSIYIRFCDTSKQAAGAMFIHFANVFLAMWSKSTDPCTWLVIVI